MPENFINSNSSLSNLSFSNEAKIGEKVENRNEPINLTDKPNLNSVKEQPDSINGAKKPDINTETKIDQPQEYLNGIVDGISQGDLTEGSISSLGLSIKDQNYILNQVGKLKFGHIKPKEVKSTDELDPSTRPSEPEKVDTGDNLSSKRDYFRQQATLKGEAQTELKEVEKSPQEIIDYIQANSFQKANDLELLKKHPGFGSRFKAWLAGDNDFKISKDGKIEEKKLAIYGRKFVSSVLNKRVATASAVAIGMSVLTGGIGATAGGTIIGSAVGRAAGEMLTAEKELAAKREVLNSKAKVWKRLESLSKEYKSAPENEKATLLKQIVDLYHEEGQDETLDLLAKSQVNQEIQQKRLDKVKKRFQMIGELAGLAGGLGFQHLSGHFDAIDLDFFNKVDKQNIFHSVISHAGGNYAQFTGQETTALKALGNIANQEVLLRGVSQSSILMHALVERGLPVLLGAYAGELFNRKSKKLESSNSSEITPGEPITTEPNTTENSTEPSAQVSDSDTNPGIESQSEPIATESTRTPEPESESKPKDETERKKFWENEMLKYNHSKLPEKDQTWIERKDGQPNGDMVTIESSDFKLDPPRVAIRRENESYITHEFVAIDDFLKNYVRGEKIKPSSRKEITEKIDKEVEDNSLKKEADKVRKELLGKELDLNIFGKKNARGELTPSFSSIKHNGKSYDIELVPGDYKEVKSNLEERLKATGAKSIKEKVTLIGTKLRGDRVVLVLKLVSK